MANAAAKIFVAYLETKGVNGGFIDEDESIVRMGWKLNNASISIYFFFGEDCEDVAIRGRDFLSVPKDKIDKVYKVLNACNSKFRWVKFTLDEEDGEVCVESDAVIQLDSVAEECFELMMRMSNIADDAYPEFMKALWA